MFAVVLKMIQWVKKSIGYSRFFFCDMVSGIACFMIYVFFFFFEIFV